MIPTRESIISALQAKLAGTVFSQPVSGVTSFKGIYRRLVLWADCPKSSRPALYITEHSENNAFKAENTPALTTMRVDLFIYLDSSDMASVPAIDVNVILDAVTKAIAPTPGFEQRQTLGGLVSHCRIDGEILKDPGDLDGDGLILIPILILVT